MELFTDSLEQTQDIGRVIANSIQPGLVIGMNGDLGAGKTNLVQAIADGLGVVDEEVNSPTFVIIQEYAGRIPICHMDAYRLESHDEFLALGADELLGADNVCLIEWADRVADVLPLDRLTIELSVTGESSRRLKLVPSGPMSEDVCSRIQTAWKAHNDDSDDTQSSA